MKHAFLMQLSDGSEINPVSKRRVMEVMAKLQASVFQDGENYMILREKTGTRTSLEWTYYNKLGWFIIWRQGTYAFTPVTSRAVSTRRRDELKNYRHELWSLAPIALVTRGELLRVLKRYLQHADRAPDAHWYETAAIRRPCL